jgi:segregation and condensation protein A
LPTPPAEEADEEMVDPRLELVRQLLEYKTYKDAARTLEEAGDDRARKHARQPVMPERAEDEVELEALQIWDLFDAFNRLLEQIGKAETLHEVGVDDTPITLHADDILDSIQRAGGTQPFEDVFAGRTRAEMIGLFLALLELIRRFRIRAIQERPFGPIEIHLLDATPLTTVEMENNELPDDSQPPEPSGQNPDEEEAAPDEYSREPQVPYSSRRPDANVPSSVDSASADRLPDTEHAPKLGDETTQDVVTPTCDEQTLEAEQDDDPQ